MSQEQKSKINAENIEQREKKNSSRSVPSEERRYQEVQDNAEVERMEEKNKKIFRGLGYNIISNSKFEYDM